MLKQQWIVLPVVAMTLAVVVGCGGSDVDRYQASGTVTYQGNPVPQGTIMFEPDTSKGNSGAAGMAMIVEGRYDTASEGGKGISGGPQIVTIQGFDGVDPNPEYAPYGSPIGGGKSYIKRFDFPEAQAIEQDFEMADVVDGP
ncbi:hypothetical protein [Roseimaritima sediminicola]|uniref:hypothetical protein n=1 Tax=Roseimaritima sediminicola TaxID=2662066 RepID=UPI0012982FD6|nr:hypothetical protein [Roseimaritima sediminicola]